MILILIEIIVYTFLFALYEVLIRYTAQWNSIKMQLKSQITKVAIQPVVDAILS